MSRNAQRNFVIVKGLSTHTTNPQDVSVRHLPYKKFKSWAYVTYSIHPTTSVEETVRQLNEKTNCTVTEIIEPATMPVRMSRAV